MPCNTCLSIRIRGLYNWVSKGRHLLQMHQTWSSPSLYGMPRIGTLPGMIPALEVLPGKRPCIGMSIIQQGPKREWSAAAVMRPQHQGVSHVVVVIAADFKKRA